MDVKNNAIDELRDKYSDQIEQNVEDTKEKEDSSAKVELFFSFDIVNSTAYKELHSKEWPNDIVKLIMNIKDAVTKYLPQAALWRIIGDEIVFVSVIKDDDEIYSAIDQIYSILISNCNGDKAKNNIPPFDLQAAAWIASVRDAANCIEKKDFDCINKVYQMFPQKDIVEYLGTDIDVGFRIKKETEKRRLVVSFELALLLNERTQYSSRLHIITYKSLKGVWEGRLYPIIWYYDRRLHREVPFSKSFLYDEGMSNNLAKEYFKNHEQRRGDMPEYLFLDTNQALTKVRDDHGTEGKIEYFKSIIASSGQDTRAENDTLIDNLLEFHCAAVCCDVENRRILVVKRKNREHLDELWEFGCAKASTESRLSTSVKEKYKDDLGIEIELVCDLSRSDKMPIPIGLYELIKDRKIHNGVIVVAKIVGGTDLIAASIENNGRHSDYRWLKESEIDSFDEKAVPDFKNSMHKVFDRWDNLFGER